MGEERTADAHAGRRRVSRAAALLGALVLEVHYLEKQKSDAVGESGLDVVIAPGTPKKSASVLAWASFFTLPPKKESVEVRATCASRRPGTSSDWFRAHARARDERVVRSIGWW